jgi:hypothetical protein
MRMESILHDRAQVFGQVHLTGVLHVVRNAHVNTNIKVTGQSRYIDGSSSNGIIGSVRSSSGNSLHP